MTDADAKRLASIRAVYAVAQPPYTDIDFLLRVLDETNTERDAIAAANAEKADDLAEWNEIAIVVQEAIGPDGSLPASALPPMNFDTAIRKIKRHRDEFEAKAGAWKREHDVAVRQRDAAMAVVDAARSLAEVLPKGHALRLSVEAFDAANTNTEEERDGAVEHLS